MNEVAKLDTYLVYAASFMCKESVYLSSITSAGYFNQCKNTVIAVTVVKNKTSK